MSPRPGQPENADISFTAQVKARELRFRDAPETRVEFSGSPGHESGSGSDRRNLPQPVRPGVTYRDVQVDYRLAAKLSWEPGEDDQIRG
ncbi:MAG: hypothetical protein LBJ87_01795 [bacterium]|nr:hypothetical protein [bacterium]